MFIACTADPDPTLNYKDREIVDSLFRMEIDTLKVIYDSLCETRFDSAVIFKVDSIMKVRESEIEKYLERIKRETSGEWIMNYELWEKRFLLIMGLII